MISGSGDSGQHKEHQGKTEHTKADHGQTHDHTCREGDLKGRCHSLPCCICRPDICLCCGVHTDKSCKCRKTSTDYVTDSSQGVDYKRKNNRQYNDKYRNGSILPFEVGHCTKMNGCGYLLHQFITRRFLLHPGIAETSKDKPDKGTNRYNI
ncbi:MAG: hypothetical protein BWY45_00946 [Euryarchaeota archaeon ADurb.Bin294]|nr:MAG: hypothetical protein BWY45_00946 [Euryarchaeota archaeon ADurb.Bin294]